MPAKPSLTGEQLVSCGIRLLEALTAAPDQTLAITDAAHILGISEAEVPLVVQALGALADRTSGARAVLQLQDGAVHLQGDAALISPLRLTFEESMVLAHVLDVLDIDAATRERVRRAVMPADDRAPADAIAEPARYGAWFTQLSEAIEDGVRCRLSYRSLHDERPTERLVDPIALQDEYGETYLVAWDVAKNAERRYRLDRIDGLSFTDDSVEPHAATCASTAESLAATGAVARLQVPDMDYARRLDWAGIGGIAERADGAVQLDVRYSSEAWLSDQVLSAGGEMQIVAPADLRERLVTYGTALLDA